MGSWLTKHGLSHVASRLRSLRDELATVDEQLLHLADDADDLAIRALVSETPGAALPSGHCSIASAVPIMRPTTLGPSAALGVLDRRLSGTTELPWTAEVLAIASSRRAPIRRSAQRAPVFRQAQSATPSTYTCGGWSANRAPNDAIAWSAHGSGRFERGRDDEQTVGPVGDGRLGCSAPG